MAGGNGQVLSGSAEAAVPALHADIRDVGRHNLQLCDVLVGGFPCQDLSVAGKRAGLSGKRSVLFWEFVRVARELRPTWLVIENVPGLLSSNGGRDMGAVIGGLEDAGYCCAWRVLDSQWFGVAQRRRRVFIVGHADARCAGAVLFEPEGGAGHPATVRKAGTDITHALDAVTGGVSAKENQQTIIPYTIHGTRSGESRDPQRTERHEPLCARSPSPSRQGNQSATVIAYNVVGTGQEGANHAYATDRTGALQHKGNAASGNEAGTVIAYTLRENDRNKSQGPANLVGYALNAHGGSHERIDGESETFVGAPPHAHRVREATGLPPGMDGKRYRALGNAVTVPVIEWLARRIMAVQMMEDSG
jgi:DNA (cytosine-5)-methyltransferase 1